MRIALLSLAVLPCLGATPRALAADWYTGATPPKAEADWIVTLNSSVDITSQNSYFADVNATIAPGREASESGPRARIDALGGRYSYNSTGTGVAVRGTQESGAALLGYEWMTPDLSVAAYLGGDVRNNSLSVFDPTNPVIGTSFGAKGSIEFYAQPSTLTMIAGYASYETNKSAYFTRLRGGFLVAPSVYLGPEVAALGDAFFNQERIGVQLSGLRIGAMRLALAGGYLYDRVRKSGAYATIDARVGF